MVGNRWWLASPNQRSAEKWLQVYQQGAASERERSSQLSQELQRVSEELDAKHEELERALERLAQIERLA